MTRLFHFDRNGIILSAPTPHVCAFTLLPLAVLTWFLLYLTGSLNLFPLFCRFVITILILSWLPGFILFHLLNLGSTTWKSYNTLSIILVSFSLSFSWTFILNVLVFTLELNISQTIKLNCLLILVLSIGLWFIRRKQQNRHNIETFAKIPYTGIVTFGGVLFLTFILYRFLPSGFMVEELIVLRKIFESDAITMRGMAYMPAEATTYIFFPFYLLVAMISRAVSVDVVIGVSMMRGFTLSLIHI